jgi:hypothetical protein
LHGEADLIGFFNDPDGDRGDLGHPQSLISRIGEHLSDKGEWSPRGVQDRTGGPPLSQVFTVWLSMMEAVGEALGRNVRDPASAEISALEVILIG